MHKYSYPRLILVELARELHAEFSSRFIDFPAIDMEINFAFHRKAFAELANQRLILNMPFTIWLTACTQIS